MNETAAFMKLVEQHDRGLRMLAYRLLQDRTVMDDVMQDAYLKAFRAFSGFRGEAQTRTWLYRIVYNACLDSLRSKRRQREVSLDSLTGSGAEAGVGPWAGAGIIEGGADGDAGRSRSVGGNAGADPRELDPAESVAQKHDLAVALALLPAEQRAAVILVDAAGFAYGEAAEVLGVRPGTIGSRLHEARSALRKTLAEGRGYETI